MEHNEGRERWEFCGQRRAKFEHWCMGKGVTRQFAEDVVSAASLKFAKARSITRGAWESYFRRCVYTCLIDALKRAGRDRLQAEAEITNVTNGTGTFQDTGMEPARLVEWRSFIESVPCDDPRDRTIVWLKGYENCSIVAIGEMLGFSDDTVRRRMAQFQERAQEYQ